MDKEYVVVRCMSNGRCSAAPLLTLPRLVFEKSQQKQQAAAPPAAAKQQQHASSKRAPGDQPLHRTFAEQLRNEEQLRQVYVLQLAPPAVQHTTSRPIN